MILKPTLRLDFCDFWKGFDKTDNWFYHVLSHRFKLVLSDQPDLILYSDGATEFHRLHTCKKIYFAVEAHAPNWNECDYALTCHHLQDPRHLRLPFYVLYARPDQLVKSAREIDQLISDKTKFCSFVVSNPDKRKRSPRAEFFQLLDAKRRVDSAGTFLNNMDGWQIPFEHGAKTRFLKNYRFNIAFENRSVPGYITEKIVEAMVARCIPIYWGDPGIVQEFNPGSFLNAHDFTSMEDLVSRVLEIEESPAAYRQIMEAPYLPAVANPYFDLGRLYHFFQMALDQKITPVGRRGSWFLTNRWVLARKV